MHTHERLTNSEMKFQEACRGLSGWQVRKLDELRRVGMAEKNEATPERKRKNNREVEPLSTKKEKREYEESVCTQELLDLQPPKTSHGLKDEALQASPVPCRKKNLKENMNTFKKPAASMKRPAGSPDKNKKVVVKDKKKDKLEIDYKKVNMRIMPYYKTTAVAVVASGVGQLFQILKFKNLDKNMKAAKNLMAMLKAGQSLQKVLEAKDNL